MRGAKSLLALRQETGSPPQTTMRGHLQDLTNMRILERCRRNNFPGNVEYRLADAGRELLSVVAVLSAWLAISPDGPTEFGTGPAKSAIKALVGGWSTNMVRALAARPLTLTELDAVIPSVSYPSLERRLAAMRMAKLVEPSTSDRRGTPYRATDWLRQAIAPLAAAARWERRRMRDRAPSITSRDVEAAFLLALPLTRLAPELSGACSVAVLLGPEENRKAAGVVAAIDKGAAAVRGADPAGPASAAALGNSGAWFAAVIEGNRESLDISGDARLAEGLLNGLHGALFPASAYR